MTTLKRLKFSRHLTHLFIQYMNRQVTLVTSFKSTRQRLNIREIFVPNVNVYDEYPNLFNTSNRRITMDLFPIMVTYCNQALGATEVQAAVKEGVDLLMVYNYITDCFLSIAHTERVWQQIPIDRLSSMT